MVLSDTRLQINLHTANDLIENKKMAREKSLSLFQSIQCLVNIDE